MTSIRLPTMVLPALHSIQRCVLWVGALLLSSVATTEYHLEKKDKERFLRNENIRCSNADFPNYGHCAKA